MHFATLVRVYQVSHCLYLRIVLVPEAAVSMRMTSRSVVNDLRLGLLTVERIDLAARQHVSKHKILEHLYPLRRTGFVVILEGVEEVFARTIPLAYNTNEIRTHDKQRRSTASRSPIHILPPHSLMTPRMRG